MKTKPVKRKNSDKLNYRAFSVRVESGKPITLNEKERSVEVVGATEEAVEVFDYERFEIVLEVLLMSGLEMPKSRQVPLFDTHRRFDTASLIGSYRNMETQNSQLLGRVHFSSVPEAEGPYTKVKECHLTDFSVGYKPIRSEWVPAGTTIVVQGRSYEGPVKVTTRWRVKELSCVPIGADEQAKVRNDTRKENNDKGENTMSNKEMSDRKIQDERDRVMEIGAMCQKFDLVPLGNQLIADGSSVEEARKEAVAAMERRIPDDDADRLGHRVPVEVGYEAVEKRRHATIDGLVLRAGVNLENPAPGANEYRVLSLVDIARETLVGAGVKTRGLSSSRIIKAALQSRAAITSDFSSLLAGTAHKVLRESYDMSPGTYELWCNVTENPDFKEMSRNQLSEAPDLDEVPEHTPYKYGKFTDAKEVFQIASFGKLFGITRQALINDDLAAFTRIPMAFAQSAKRKVNAAAYAALTANAALADGVALFHADHSNYVGSGSGAAPAIATLDAARTAMRTQTGLQGAILNIAPRFIIVPAALETTTDTVLNSAGDLDDNKSSAVKNPFFGKLEPVVEACLDAGSATAWYLASDKNACDTVEVCFLSGSNNGPYLETKEGWTVDGVEYKVRIEFGVKAIDYRGLYCNFGA